MSNVVKRLRNKIWIILIASFYTLIVTILVILYLLSSQRAQEATYQALYSSLFSEELHFSNLFFSIDIDTNNEIVDIHSCFDLSVNRYELLVKTVLENARDHNIIRLDEETWAYAFLPAGELFYDDPEFNIDNIGWHQRIVFVNAHDIYSRHYILFWRLVAIGGASLLIIISGSFFVAKYFVRSTKKSFEAHEKMTAQQKKFTANATHELKTPIAMIKGSYDEILRNKEKTVESQIKWFDMIEFGTRRMESLTNELLTLAKLEGQKIELPTTKINVSEIVEKTVEIMQVLANEKDIQIIKDIQPDLMIELNEEKFMQVGMIILENAIKYVNDSGRIEVLAHKKDDQIIISTLNSGPGIPAKALPKLFDYFYRVDEKSKAGTGLGLPIAKEIIEQMGGEIVVDSIVNEVTVVVLKF